MSWRNTIKEEAPSTSSWRDSIKEEESVSPLVSTGLGTAQGALMNYGDEIYGGIKSAFTDVPYEQARDEARAFISRAEKQNPNAFLGGQVAGGIGTALIPGVGLAKGASLGANLARGAALGGISGIGGSTSEDFTEDALTGAGFGLAGAGAAAGIGKAVEQLPKIRPALDEYTEKMGLKALGPTINQEEKLAEGTGKMLFDKGYIKPFSGADDIAQGLQKDVSSLYKSNKALVENLDESGKLIQTSPVIRELQSRIQQLRADGQGNKADAMETLYNKLLKQNPGMELELPVKTSMMENIKRDAQGSFETLSNSVQKKAEREYASLLRRNIESGVKEIAPDVAPQYAATNAELSKLISPMEIAQRTALKEGRQAGLERFLDPTRTLPEAYKTLASPAIKGSVSNSLSKIVGQTPERLGKYAPVLQQAAQRGNHSLAITNYLLQQKEPEYREQIRQLEQDDER